MREDFRPTVTVQLGDDGNPQIETNCVGLEASKLCVALLAALAAGSDDPAGALISIVTRSEEHTSELQSQR